MNTQLKGCVKKIKTTVVESAEALGLSISNLDSTRSRRDYNRYDILLSGSDDSLVLETAIMTPASPFSERPLQSFIGQLAVRRGQDDIIQSYGLEQFEVKANSLERAFADKVFATCDYYLCGSIPSRQSRHIYDLYKLLPHIKLDSNMSELMTTVRSQRVGSYRCPSAEPEVDLAATLHSILESDAYRGDYETVTVPLLYESVDYATASGSLATIADFLESN